MGGGLLAAPRRRVGAFAPPLASSRSSRRHASQRLQDGRRAREALRLRRARSDGADARRGRHPRVHATGSGDRATARRALGSVLSGRARLLLADGTARIPRAPRRGSRRGMATRRRGAEHVRIGRTEGARRAYRFPAEFERRSSSHERGRGVRQVDGDRRAPGRRRARGRAGLSNDAAALRAERRAAALPAAPRTDAPAKEQGALDRGRRGSRKIATAVGVPAGGQARRLPRASCGRPRNRRVRRRAVASTAPLRGGPDHRARRGRAKRRASGAAALRCQGGGRFRAPSRRSRRWSLDRPGGSALLDVRRSLRAAPRRHRRGRLRAPGRELQASRGPARERGSKESAGPGGDARSRRGDRSAHPAARAIEPCDAGSPDSVRDRAARVLAVR